MPTARTQIRLGGCPGWSEFLLGAQAILLVLSWGGSISYIITKSVYAVCEWQRCSSVQLSLHIWAMTWHNQQCGCAPSKTQISLGICPVWLESSLSAWRKLRSSVTYWAHCEDSDQTGRLSRLIWSSLGAQVILLGLLWDGSYKGCRYCSVYAVNNRGADQTADAQADLHRCLHKISRFSRDVVQMLFAFYNHVDPWQILFSYHVQADTRL